jgi:hypothetical protein
VVGRGNCDFYSLFLCRWNGVLLLVLQTGFVDESCFETVTRGGDNAVVAALTLLPIASRYGMDGVVSAYSTLRSPDFFFFFLFDRGGRGGFATISCSRDLSFSRGKSVSRPT